MNQEIVGTENIGIWIGRGQVLGAIASQCSAAQANCLRQIRESGYYKSLNMTWDQFCAQYTGLKRQRVDAIIRNLDEFGPTYYHLSEIVNVSPDTYRQIAPKVQGDAIEIEGEMVAIVSENAPRIRVAVNRMRAELLKNREKRYTGSPLSVISLQSRLEACFEEIRCMTPRFLVSGEHKVLLGLIHYSIDNLKKIEKQFPDR